MQAVDEDVVGTASAAKGAVGLEGKGGPDGLQGQRDPDASRRRAGDGLDNRHCSQGAPAGQGDPDCTVSHADPEDSGSACSEGAEGTSGDCTPQSQLASHARRPDGDAVPAAGGPASRLIELTLTVPFRTPLEANMARRSLSRDARRHIGVIHKELTANGNVLAVTWVAEDPVFFRAAINTFLDRLCLVVQNFRRFGPHVFH